MKHIKSLFLAALLCLTTTVFAAYDGVPVTPEPITADNYPLYHLTPDNYTDYLDKYVIEDAAHLYGLSKLMSEQTKSSASADAVHVVITADIVVNENCVATVKDGGVPTNSWVPLNTYNHTRLLYLDGQGHTISGLYFNNTENGYAGENGGNYVGFVSYLNGGSISNLSIEDSYFCGKNRVGAIVGHIQGGSGSSITSVVENCYTNAVLESTADYVSGIAAYAIGATSIIRDCCFAGEVYTANGSFNGGICGYMSSATVTGCLSIGSVKGPNNDTGAIGHSDNARVKNCYYLEGSAVNHKTAAPLSGLARRTADIVGETESVSQARLATGEVCWLLAGADNASTASWYQKLGTDLLPSVKGTDRVYAIGSARCDGVAKPGTTYSNTPGSFVKDDHTMVNGLCTVCNHCDESWLAPAGDGWFELGNAAQLYWFSEYVAAGHPSANARLTADITLNEGVWAADSTLATGDFRQWHPIGTKDIPYTGTFDGQHHTINGLVINRPVGSEYPAGGNYSGLFGATQNATLRNINLDRGYVYGGEYVGSLVGYARYTTISRCHNGNTVLSGEYGYVGGLVGNLLASSTVTSCYNTGRIGVAYSKVYVGGIAGNHTGTSITNCYNVGQVYGSSYAGAIVGSKNSSSTLVDCHYLKGSARIKTGAQNGVGSTSGSVMTDVKGCSNPFLADVLTSGELTWVLNGKTASGTLTWYQSLTVDPYPVLNSTSKVYASGTVPCDGNTDGLTYQNEPASPIYEEHEYVNHLCVKCGHLHPDHTVAKVDGVYQIATAADLYWLADTIRTLTSSTSASSAFHAVLTADIVVNEHCLDTIKAGGKPKMGWTPIGIYGHNRIMYFDGQGHTISGIYFDNTDYGYAGDGGGNYLGLFGYVPGGTIRNLGIKDSYFRGLEEVGAIVGYARTNNTTLPMLIENCYSEATVEARSYSGGLVGMAYDALTRITDCYNAGEVTISSSYGGGVGGYMSSVTVSNCMNIGKVTATAYNHTGAICYSQGATVQNCYYLEGSAKMKNGTLLYGMGKQTSDSNGQTEKVTAAQLASGEVCWHLNGSTNDDTDFHWFQSLPTDTLPGFVATGSNNVYVNSDLHCDGTPKAAVYANTYHAQTKDSHSYVNGLCSFCGHCDETWMSPATDGYFEIGTAAQLYWFSEYVAAGHPSVNARLTADITLNEGVWAADSTLATGDFRQWRPIGTKDAPYTGTFDGQLHTIYGMYINRPSTGDYPFGGDYSGLFGAVEGATLRDVTVDRGYVCGAEYVAGIAAYVKNAKISRCHNGNTIISAYYGFAGGIIASDAMGTQITTCYNTGKIGEGNTRVYIGGIAGRVTTTTPLTNCYNVGRVNGNSLVGAIVGERLSGANNPIQGCYYLAGSATSISGVQNGVGAPSNSVMTDVAGATTPFSADILPTGELTGTMNALLPETVWLQTIGVDALPSFVGDTVFRVVNCPEGYTYSNTRTQMHTLTYEEKVDATCTGHGHVAGYTCSVCHKHFEDETALIELSELEWVIAKLGHNAVADEYLAPTCTEAGHEGGSHCSRCGVVVVPATVLDPLGHDTVADLEVEATCTEAGLTVGSHCSRCHTVFVAQEVVPAHGHEFLHYVYNNDATQAEDGTETAMCEHGCGASDTRTAEGTRIVTDITGAMLGDELHVHAHHHTLIIENAAGTIRVFDAAGRLVAETQHAVCHQHTEIELTAHGTYVVTCDNASRKVVIR